MNELLKDLEKRSVFFNEEDSVFEFDREKFAQLIVRECVKLNSKELSITAIERLLPLYEEHFGVEE